MTFGGTRATAYLFAGDIAVFVTSLWFMLLVRYGQVPTMELLYLHVSSFVFLFGVWVLVFYMAGLYSKRVALFKKEMPAAILGAQVANVLIAALFFFFMPIGIEPKTNLVLYLIISVAMMFTWRLGLFPRFTKPGERERAALIGAGPEIEELKREVNAHARYHIEFPVVLTPEALAEDFNACATLLTEKRIATLVIDTDQDALRPFLPQLYALSFVSPGYGFLDFYQVYEEVFDRVPLSLLQYDWFLKNVSSPSSNFYELAKRAIDIFGGLAMGLVTLIAIPFIYIAMRLEGPGALFITQERIGKYGTRMVAYKFRSMKFNKSSSREWTKEEAGDNPITKVGAFLRLTSLDEFPQFINVLRGELSLVGPRNDIVGLGQRLGESIPYYNVRYIVKPGITGWAQINQQYEPGNISPQSVEETKTRLAYDFYYIKKRSLILDIVIALKTVKRMFFRLGTW
ncbi:MAG TPA: sugar transferase [Candidatus Paceibacterota bacterium]|nr:sugar transferase [Candidatus Paceibacterota bacterium]